MAKRDILMFLLTFIKIVTLACVCHLLRHACIIVYKPQTSTMTHFTVTVIMGRRKKDV